MNIVVRVQLVLNEMNIEKIKRAWPKLFLEPNSYVMLQCLAILYDGLVYARIDSHGNSCMIICLWQECMWPNIHMMCKAWIIDAWAYV